MCRWLVLALVVGCGDPAVTPRDAAADASVPPPGCVDIAESTTGELMTSAAFGPAEPGTLSGWDPAGRWFLTGTDMGGVSSFFFSAPSGTAITIDRNASVPGEISADEIFWRGAESVHGL